VPEIGDIKIDPRNMSGKRSASGRGKVRLDRRTGKKQRDERKTPNETSGSDSSDSDDSSLAGIGKQEMRKRLREMEKQLQSAKTLCQMQHENTNFVSMVTPTANRVRRLDESERGERNFNLQKKGYKKQIKDYIKDKWYDEMKFIEHSQIPVRMVEEMIVEKWLTVPNGLTTRGFIEKCEPLVVSSLKGIRQSSQQLMRQRWIGKKDFRSSAYHVCVYSNTDVDLCAYCRFVASFCNCVDSKRTIIKGEFQWIFQKTLLPD
jgi:hypothetical protein